MRIIKTSKSVVAASDSTSGADLKGALRSTLDSDICADIVNLAYSEDNVFAEQVFIESESFFDALISKPISNLDKLDKTIDFNNDLGCSEVKPSLSVNVVLLFNNWFSYPGTSLPIFKSNNLAPLPMVKLSKYAKLKSPNDDK